ncbi:hypothetical protein [Pseudonocardia sp. GCM10023141]|uniref:hypothetical protein n=1 Tax=Pseudonocardia sp. GCM10023141 TaxID=3252653 RepID=UPI0036162CF6
MAPRPSPSSVAADGSISGFPPTVSRQRGEPVDQALGLLLQPHPLDQSDDRQDEHAASSDPGSAGAAAEFAAKLPIVQQSINLDIART